MSLRLRFNLGFNNNSTRIKLESKDTHDDKYAGTIPAKLGALSRLDWLTLSDNQLSGKFCNTMCGIALLHAWYFFITTKVHASVVQSGVVGMNSDSVLGGKVDR